MDSVEVGQFSAILLFIYRFLLFWVALHKVSPKIFYQPFVFQIDILL